MFIHVGLIIGVLIILFPIWLAFVASTVTNSELVQPPMPLWPGDQLVENCSKALVSGVTTPVATMLFNSLIMAMGIAIGKFIIWLLSAFAIVHFKFPGRRVFFWAIFLTLMLPLEVRIVPTYEVVAGFGLLNSYTGLIFPLIASATATFLFRQFFMTAPHELAEAARALQLEPYQKRKPRELSGGQRQRVAIGRAMVHKPKVFLFDEPLLNPDAKLRVRMRPEITELQARLGITALFVTHDQLGAMTLADRVIAMSSGVADQIRAPLEVYSDPRTEFVAGFIGSPATNFLAAENWNWATTAHRVGIRPEHAHLVAAQDGQLQGTAMFNEALGTEILIHFKMDKTGEMFTVRRGGSAHTRRHMWYRLGI